MEAFRLTMEQKDAEIQTWSKNVEQQFQSIKSERDDLIQKVHHLGEKTDDFQAVMEKLEREIEDFEEELKNQPTEEELLSMLQLSPELEAQLKEELNAQMA